MCLQIVYRHRCAHFEDGPIIFCPQAQGEAPSNELPDTRRRGMANLDARAPRSFNRNWRVPGASSSTELVSSHHSRRSEKPPSSDVLPFPGFTGISSRDSNESGSRQVSLSVAPKGPQHNINRKIHGLQTLCTLCGAPVLQTPRGLDPLFVIGCSTASTILLMCLFSILHKLGFYY